jgi:hypothetical protein
MGGANGSRECAPDDKLRNVNRILVALASRAKVMGFASALPIPRAGQTSGANIHEDDGLFAGKVERGRPFTGPTW